jgi:hypothetical protein
VPAPRRTERRAATSITVDSGRTKAERDGTKDETGTRVFHRSTLLDHPVSGCTRALL